MIQDPELKAMSDVFEALKHLDHSVRVRVSEWVLSRLKNSAGSASAESTGSKRRGRPAGKKASGKKRGRPAKNASETVAKAAKKTGKRGRPAGSKNKSAFKAAAKKTGRKRGRPSKKVASAATA